MTRTAAVRVVPWGGILLACAALGCEDPLAPQPEFVVVRTDSTSYARNPATGQFHVTVTLINHGSSSVESQTCNFSGATGIAWAIAKDEGGQWKTITSYGASCGSLTIAHFTLKPRERRTFRVSGLNPAGRYRLAVYLFDATHVSLSHWSAPWTITQ